MVDVSGQVIEGHVPAAAVEKLIAKPAVKGVAVARQLLAATAHRRSRTDVAVLASSSWHAHSCPSAVSFRFCNIPQSSTECGAWHCFRSVTSCCSSTFSEATCSRPFAMWPSSKSSTR
ncbi:DUF411 domain-containing protein [Noviherbaspirillum cavernae]|uniref:DUF411 domain-containing protein n=1 Tax=Noviherbaspirillum cavernae TaxID=2320862 RepID=UPI001F5BF647|nr:DUF411 domain-containing protein [Noviherbaspirillum cavernae]